MFFRCLLPPTCLDASMHIEKDPPVARRSTIKQADIERSLARRGRPVNRFQVVAGDVVADPRGTDGTFENIGARPSFTGSPAWSNLDRRQGNDYVELRWLISLQPIF